MTKTLRAQIFSSKTSRKGVSEHFDHITQQAVDTSYTTSSEQVRAADCLPELLDNEDKR